MSADPRLLKAASAVQSDTYGNVVSEAQASGVPAVVMNGGGPKFLVRNGVDGFVANSPREFAARIVELHGSPDLLGRLRLGAREAALGRSWEAVFEGEIGRAHV